MKQRVDAPHAPWEGTIVPPLFISKELIAAAGRSMIIAGRNRERGRTLQS
jgi:hypothetical protein